MVKTARTRRLIRELILDGKLVDTEKPPKKEPEPPKSKLHLNICRLLYMFKRVKNKIFLSKKGKGQSDAQLSEGDQKTIRNLNDIWGIVKFVVGYGIIGGFVLFLAIMLLPLQLPLAVWIKGSVITQIAISILGMGSLAYLYYDATLFAASLRNRGSESK